MRYKIIYSCVSHIGKIRSVNQDNLICDGRYMDSEPYQAEFSQSGSVESKNNSLFGVFDGMGGEECGEIASFIAAKEAMNTDFNEDGVECLSDYCQRANTAICDYAEANGVSTMGTTAAMLLFTENEITLCNIGDSKIYRFSGENSDQISKDHVAFNVFGKKPPLTQHLGVPPQILLIEPYFSHGAYKSGDKYLICSDGLTDMLAFEEINRIVNENSVEEATSVLLEKALENGGRDNVTIILLEIKQEKNKLLSVFKR